MQFSLRSLFALTLLFSMALAVARVIGVAAIVVAIVMAPAAIVVTAYIVRTIKTRDRPTLREVAVAVAISLVSALIVLLGLAILACMPI